jgi:hypothetical protein
MSEAGRVEHLERALREAPGAGMERAPVMALDDQARHAARGQEHRGGKADEAAAGDEHGDRFG